MAKERHVSAEAALSSGTVGFDAASNASSVVEERDVCIDEVAVDILKAPFNPCIEDADPDCSPPPKDGDPIPWKHFYCWWFNNWNLKQKSGSGIGGC